MKIRLGFVSNSSTSSFAIYGVILSRAEATRRLKEKGHLSTLEDVDEFLYEASKKSALSYYDADGDVVMGMAFPCMQDTETKIEFQERVTAELEAIFGEGVECAFHQGECPL